MADPHSAFLPPDTQARLERVTKQVQQADEDAATLRQRVLESDSARQEAVMAQRRMSDELDSAQRKLAQAQQRADLAEACTLPIPSCGGCMLGWCERCP